VPRKPIVLSDIDSTLADVRHRHHLAPHNTPGNTWQDFSMACADDEPFMGPITLLQMLSDQYPIYLVSSRDDAAYDLTMKWLDRYEVPCDVLRLRKPSEREDNSIYKMRYIKELQADGFDIKLVLEDWPPVVQVLRDHGLNVVCVNPMYSHVSYDDELQI
jgi:hypothetical protein